jgi:hypothetical protein
MTISALLSGFVVTALIAIAAPITVGPIPITGGGSYGCGGPELCFFGMFFAGSDGPDSVSVNAQGDSGEGYGGPYGEFGPVTFVGSLGNTIAGFDLNGTAEIDGITGTIDSFDVACCTFEGTLDIFMGSGSGLLASATLYGEIITTSYTSTGFDVDSGTFVIVATPEPGTLILVAAGLIFMVLRHFKCALRDHRPLAEP